MNVIDIFDQFTTTWGRIRAAILSHVFAAVLLWFAGFAPPMPDIDFADLAAAQTHPLYQMFSGAGFLALVSLALALAVGVYAIALREIGRLITPVLVMLFPPDFDFARMFRIFPARVLFVFAATLEGGTYEPRDLRNRINELINEYSSSRQDEFKGLLSGSEEVQRDTATWLQNAATFLAAWIVAPWLLPEGNPLALAIDQVYWRGLVVLTLYLFVARGRYVFSLKLAYLQFVWATATLIRKDESQADRLAAARANPEPYLELVRRYRDEDPAEHRPSLVAYFRALFDVEGPRPDKGESGRRRGPIGRALHDLNRFGWDEDLYRDYDDPAWLARYAGWRAVRVLVFLRAMAGLVLRALGLGRL